MRIKVQSPTKISELRFSDLWHHCLHVTYNYDHLSTHLITLLYHTHHRGKNTGIVFWKKKMGKSQPPPPIPPPLKGLTPPPFQKTLANRPFFPLKPFFKRLLFSYQPPTDTISLDPTLLYQLNYTPECILYSIHAGYRISISM